MYFTDSWVFIEVVYYARLNFSLSSLEEGRRQQLFKGDPRPLKNIQDVLCKSHFSVSSMVYLHDRIIYEKHLNKSGFLSLKGLRAEVGSEIRGHKVDFFYLIP